MKLIVKLVTNKYWDQRPGTVSKKTVHDINLPLQKT